MKRIALIPARGGSKRLPRKNIIDFLGKPIIAYTITAALETELFDRVVVSTEDEEISDVSRKHGAEIDRRRPELATDQSTVVDVCVDFIHRQTTPIDVLAVLYATAPLRNADDIKNVVHLLSSHVHFGMAVTKSAPSAHQTLRWNNGDVTPLFPEWVNLKSSDVETLVIDNGSTYAVRVPTFLEQKSFYGHPLKGYLMPNERSVDIDTPDDLARALNVALE